MPLQFHVDGGRLELLGDVDVAPREIDASVPPTPSSSSIRATRNLFTDASLPAYDPEAASAQVLERVRGLLERIA